MAERPDFNNVALWEVHPDINVFATHERKVKDGDKKRLVRFSKEKLQSIAEKCNRRDKVGQPCPLTLGHTIDGEPETKQPPIVGYARNFRVAYDKELGKHVIRSDYYLKKRTAEQAKEYPRTSVEVWADAGFFDPIALLKRTPQLDLGQWIYSGRYGLKLRYSMDDELDRKPLPGNPADEPSDEPEDTHEEPEGDDDGMGEEGPPPDREDGEEGHGGPEGVPPDFHQHFMKCMKHHFSDTKKYGLGDSAGDGNTPLPRRKPDMVEPARMSKSGGPQRARRTADELLAERVLKYMGNRLDKIERRMGKLTHERDDLAIRNERSDCRDLLAPLEKKGLVFDMETEVDLLLPMKPTQRDDRVKYLRATLAQDPTGGRGSRMLRTDSDRPRMSKSEDRNGVVKVNITGGVESGRGYEDEAFGNEHLELARAYQKKHPTRDWEEAEQYARGQRNISGEVVERYKRAA